MFSNLIAGLQIFQKYLGDQYIAGADHDIIYFTDVDDLRNAGISTEDEKTLEDLGFFIDEDSEVWAHYI